jgi:oligopeptide/dipeptide ABC transporter ATP-binding protein
MQGSDTPGSGKHDSDTRSSDQQGSNSRPPLLAIDHLTVQFQGERGWSTAVQDVSLRVDEGECVGLVGESGSGKSVTALSVLRLHDARSCRVQGTVRYRGEDVLGMSNRELRRLRGGEVAMIFQDPMSSLNPVLTIADQIGETLRLHEQLSKAAARRRAIELLELVRIPDAARRVDEYPHRLSGGMRQRVMIAIAMACRPKLLIADEPTTALDVTIQAQILELLRELQTELGMAVLLITHDLGVIAQLAQRVVVMYAGQVIEEAPVERLFDHPLHPYSEGLLRAIPPLDQDVHRLAAIPGHIPDPGQMPPGCRYAPRCALARASCRTTPPLLTPVAMAGASRCPVRLELDAALL